MYSKLTAYAHLGSKGTSFAIMIHYLILERRNTICKKIY